MIVDLGHDGHRNHVLQQVRGNQDALAIQVPVSNRLRAFPHVLRFARDRQPTLRRPVPMIWVNVPDVGLAQIGRERASLGERQMNVSHLVLPACLALGLLADGVAADVEVALATEGLGKRVAWLETQEDAEFELGAMMTLRAVEIALQERYRYGIGDVSWVPILRLQTIAINPEPEAASPETLGTVVRGLVANLEAARGAMPEDSVEPFELVLRDVWFDVDGDGQRGKGEDALTILPPVLLGGWAGVAAMELDTSVAVRFDTADHAWLTAYTHFLSGLAEAVLAFDPAEPIRRFAERNAALAAAPIIESRDNLKANQKKAVQADIARLSDEREKVLARLRATNARRRELRKAIAQLEERARSSADAGAIRAHEEWVAKQALLDALGNNEDWDRLTVINGELAVAEANLAELERPVDDENWKDDFIDFQPSFDAIYIALEALQQEPDKIHAKAVKRHWTAMIQQNRRFWAALDAETDDDREWIPNPRQKSVFGLEVSYEVSRAWLSVLDDAEAMLNGTLLIPHPLLPKGYGINLSAWFDDPSDLDLVAWVHGTGAYPYAARGPRISARSWTVFQRMAGGNAGRMALLFN
ncbi:hypothetical protein [Antarctobacter jejuensis]|uniref:hypothetical protein n=1 Tax=Antarctobacter jejuensis TaxID=1439938 RepID=UPI003FCFA6F6